MKLNDIEWTTDVTTPSHYREGGIQPLDYIEENKLDFCEGNVIKYVTRYKYKNGLEDLRKARYYLDKIIERHQEI